MTLEEVLLQEICANPNDDTPRLVYADWLDENGHEERAHYIRVKCGLFADKGDYEMQPVWALAVAKAFGFSTDPSDGDKGYFRHFGYGSGNELATHREVKWGWERGFISYIECECMDWVKYGRKVIKVAPIKKATLVDKRPHAINEQHYGFYATNTLNGNDDLPHCLWEHLEGIATQSWKWFNSARDLEERLSEACLTYARTTHNVHLFERGA